MPTSADFTAQADTLGHVILEAGRRWPGRAAFIFGDRQASHAEIADQTIACARGLLGLGIRRGENVGILMPNSWDYVILSSALTLIGAGAVVLNARYRGDELEYVVRQAEITVLFTTADGRDRLDLRALLVSRFPELGTWSKDQPLALGNAPSLRKVFIFNSGDEDRWPTAADLAHAGNGIDNAKLGSRIAAVTPDDPALVIFSSGTTAQPKACLVSHRSVVRVSAAIGERLRLSAEDVFWNPLPLYHLSSHLPLNACRQSGAAFVSQSHFEPAAALAELERTGATICYPAFPALTAGLIDHPDFRKRDLSRLRIQLTIGAPGLLRKFSEAMPQATQIACYGLTECGGIATMSSPDDTLEQRIGRVGRPLRGFEVRIADPETLEPQPDGTRGEILIRGPIFSGYFGDPEQTAKVLLPDGWVRSGDAGWIDEDGQLAYSDRIKDMLKIGGENVAAAEIESFLALHPKIKMAQVIAAPDDRLVEVAAAYIELNSGEYMTVDDVLEHCAGNIASYKIPRFVRFVSEWPMSATKVQKFRLSESFVPEDRIDVAAYLAKSRT